MVNPFCATHKDYKTKKPTRTRIRLKFLQREKVAIIKLRQHGWTIPTIAEFTRRLQTERSYSTIFGILQKSFYSFQDLRKMPDALRKQIASIQRKNIDFQLKRWLPFIEGTEDKPP